MSIFGFGPDPRQDNQDQINVKFDADNEMYSWQRAQDWSTYYNTLEAQYVAQLFEDAAKLRDKERNLVKKLSNAQKVWQNEENKSRVSIDSEMIADVVSIMTGIP